MHLSFLFVHILYLFDAVTWRLGTEDTHRAYQAHPKSSETSDESQANHTLGSLESPNDFKLRPVFISLHSTRIIPWLRFARDVSQTRD